MGRVRRRPDGFRTAPLRLLGVVLVGVSVATRGQTDMRRAGYRRTGVRLDRTACLGSSVAGSGEAPLLIAVSRVAPRAAARAASRSQLGCAGQSSSTASDQHQPASSRAIATLATTGRLPRSVKLAQRACRRRLPALSGVAAGTCRGRCKVPPGPHHRTWSVTRPMVPGRLDEQPPDVDVTGLGDLALNPRHAGGGLGGHQPHERADGVAGEPMPAVRVRPHV